jgi:hypothetical protein
MIILDRGKFGNKGDWHAFFVCHDQGYNDRQGCLSVWEVGKENLWLQRAIPGNNNIFFVYTQCSNCLKMHRFRQMPGWIESYLQVSEEPLKTVMRLVSRGQEPDKSIKGWKTHIVCCQQSNVDPEGCGALLEIGFKDLKIGCSEGTHSTSYYPIIICPVCGKNNLVQQYPDTIWAALIKRKKKLGFQGHHSEHL